MNQTLDVTSLGLDLSFPDEVYVLYHPATDRYGCFCHQGIHGVACFSDASGAMRFSELVSLPGMAVLDMSFDDARDVAKARPLPIISLMLLDKLDDPLIHYVR